MTSTRFESMFALLIALVAGCATDADGDPATLLDSPGIGGSSIVGREAICDSGTWDGSPAIALQWLHDGNEIAGATNSVYTPVATDDRSELSCAVTAGTMRVVTDPVSITRAAPELVQVPEAIVLELQRGQQTIDTATAITGDDLSFAVDGAGASVEVRTGVITIPTDVSIADTLVVTATNSGGETSFEVPVTVGASGAPIVRDTAPAVAHPAVRTVTTRTQLLDAIVTSVDGDVIKIAPGTYDRFVWPKSTSHHLTLIAAQQNNAPVMRGIWISPNAAMYYPAQSVKGSSAKNLTIDGLHFQAEELKQIRTQNNSNRRVDITDNSGRGWGWRADFTYPGVTNLGEAAGFVGLKIGGGSSDIVVKNCLFEGFAKAINTGGATRLTVANNEFSGIAEDGVIIWGGTDLTFEYNLWDHSRGISLAAAHVYGWKDNTVPPHQDFFQIACNSASQFVTRLTIRNNVMYDDTVRVHGVLLNNAYVGGSTAKKLASTRHRDVIVENNFLDQTHTTGLQLTNVVGLTARHNKVMRSREVAGSTKNDVAFIVGGWGKADGQNMSNIRVQDNVSRKFKGPWMDSWIWTNNTTSNDANNLPTGWVEVRPGVGHGGKRAGRYGQ